MSFSLECKKVRRTGFVPSFLCGGLLAAAVPALNMAFRAERYLSLGASPVQILLDANWQMMAMLNILLAVAGACLMYHTEYADGSLQKMRSLPLRESRIFSGKLLLLLLMCAAMLAIEAGSVAFCAWRWFALSGEVWRELFKSFGYALLLILPAASFSLLIASLCQSLWTSLGIGVVCVFVATMLPAKSFPLSLFPFAMPFQILAGTAENLACRFCLAAAIEFLAAALLEVCYLKIRRLFV